LDLAQRLVIGLADENVRWRKNVEVYKGESLTMIGNALLSAAFVSYIGPFSQKYRNGLWRDTWIEDIGKQKIPLTEGVDPLFVLSNSAEQALW
jgi:dynein heavy chain